MGGWKTNRRLEKKPIGGWKAAVGGREADRSGVAGARVRNIPPGEGAHSMPTGRHGTRGRTGSQGEFHDRRAFWLHPRGSFGQTGDVLAGWRGGGRRGYAGSGQGRSSKAGS